MASEMELAQSLFRMHGPSALRIAEQYAQTYEGSGDHLSIEKWRRVVGKVKELVERK